MKMTSQWLFREKPSVAEIEEFKKFLSNYKIGDILKTKLKDPDSIRILIIGYNGEGKSSFVKTLLRLCGNSKPAFDVSTSHYKSECTNTTILKYHRLTETSKSNFFICDSPGFNPTTTPTSIKDLRYSVDTMVKGCIPHGGVPYHLLNRWSKFWFLGIPDKNSIMHAVIFLAWPPINENSRLDLPALTRLIETKRELEMTLGNRPFFFVFTATDMLDGIPEDICYEILSTFGGSTFLVGKEQDGKAMPSVCVYKRLIESIFRAVEEYKLMQAN